MLCPECEKVNLDNSTTCFFCGYDFPAGGGAVREKRIERVSQWRPEYIDIHLPKGAGLVRITIKDDEEEGGGRWSA